MEKSCEFFMSQIKLVLKGETSIDSLQETINPNFIDSNGNSIFHYFSEFSLEKFYKLNFNKEKDELLKPEKYKEILNEYKNQIPVYIALFEELNCNKLAKNNKNQTPLIYSIIQKNYIIALEYIKLLNDNLTNEDYLNIFRLLINSGDCLKEDCLDLINYIISLEKEKKMKIFDKDFLNKEDENNGLTPILIICKDYNDNIYEKFNQIVRMVSSDYYERLLNATDNDVKDNYLAAMLIESQNYLNNFILKIFTPLLNDLINLGADINYTENNKKKYLPKSAFIYLMKYPLFEDISLFVKTNNINVNYKDQSGQTAFMYLIHNSESICIISKDVFNKVYNYFLGIKDIDIEISNYYNISVFGLCLIKGLIEGAFNIYENKISTENLLNFNSEILIFIINCINQPKEFKKIYQFLNKFGTCMKYYLDITFDNFDSTYQRTLLHYIFMFLKENNSEFYMFKYYCYILNKLKIDINKKDIYKRIALFYLFIDENEKIKNVDPFLKLEFCLKKNANNNLDDTDIYGNSLIFYAVQARAYRSIKLLFDFGASFDLKNNDGNTVFTTAAILGDYELFIYLYNLKKNEKEKKEIFLQQVFSSNQITSFKKPEKNKIQILIEFYKENNQPLPNLSTFLEELEKNMEQNYIYDTNNLMNDQKSEYKSNYISLLNPDMQVVSDVIINNVQIKNGYQKIFNFNKQYFNEVMEKFKNSNLNDSNIKKNLEKSSLLANNIFLYCKSKKYENFCRFMINENYHLISVCNDLSTLIYENEDELYYYINQTLYEKDLINFKNEENITIFHILAKINYKSSFYEEHNIEKYEISNLFDNLGNTPLYYSCERFNINFIEHFTNYSFSSNNNEPNKVKYSLFVESKNENSPLKSLYLQLNKKDFKILKLIIDISINIKKVYILYICLFLINNYLSSYKEYFSLPYNENLNNEDYIRKIIGLYSFYMKELNGNFAQCELEEIISFCQKNVDFLFDILLKEKNIQNYINKEGKNIIHLIVKIKEREEEKENKPINKKIFLNKALEAGFDFNLKDNSGKYPIDYAYLNKEDEIINILIDKYKSSGLKIPENKNN